jgi:hypothetical protein
MNIEMSEEAGERLLLPRFRTFQISLYNLGADLNKKQNKQSYLL